MIKIGNNISEFSTYSCQPKTYDELKEIIKDRISKDGSNCDLTEIDTSLITDMSYLFFQSNFNGDISKWKVSNVKSMLGMFTHSLFNVDISKWNVSNVTDMYAMFFESEFNQDISNWNIKRTCDIRQMFDYCPIKEEFKPKSLEVQ